jgi:hypothetical protein
MSDQRPGGGGPVRVGFIRHGRTPLVVVSSNAYAHKYFVN